MFTLTEDLAKRFLGEAGLPVPRGIVCSSGNEAGAFADTLSAGAVVKALVPAGRRGTAGAVRIVDHGEAAQAVTQSLLGTEVHGFPIEKVYVEEKISISRELFLGLARVGDRCRITLSCEGGGDLEDVVARDPKSVIRADVSFEEGVNRDVARPLWARAGLDGVRLENAAAVTAALYDAFIEAAAETMEVNPLALDFEGTAYVVGALLAIEDKNLDRHPEWAEQARSRRAAFHIGNDEQVRRLFVLK